ncbi:ATP-grasp domain-containing protein [Enterococcus hulanensis]|uniref:ATP-grasp domain-containing protein n=1 Tax=Enterococcus hulanensis TaxID=2559929 RepID=UPI001A8F1595|nr:ATP-grasp domain-containing protein [Enterococcus hulanensis]MBO0455271.1 ATP-grasp domain-containing protein [Enterococcus hulanensis]
MSNKKLMILGASILQVPAINKAKEMGLNVVVVDIDPDAMGFQVAGIDKEIISTIDGTAILEAAKRQKIDGIMTLATDMPVRSIAMVAKEMGLIGITEKTAIQTTNKVEMRKALKKENVPIPLFFKVSDINDFLIAVEKIRNSNYRCIVKPADNSGSRGVTFITDYNSDNLIDIFKYSKKYSRSGDLIVEEFMEGPEVSVETLSIDGICHIIQITDKLTTGAPYFVETGHSQPSKLPKLVQDSIEKLAKKANKAVGIMSGPSHTEIKITKDGPKIIELGARLGGDNITTHLVPLSTGMDMIKSCIQIALGEKADFHRRFEKASAIRYFKVEEGRIKKIEGIEKARGIQGVQQVNFKLNEGEYIPKIKSSIDRCGYVISQANTTIDAERICEKAISNINVEVVE